VEGYELCLRWGWAQPKGLSSWPCIVFGNEPLIQSQAGGCAEMKLNKLGLDYGKLMQVRLNLLCLVITLSVFKKQKWFCTFYNDMAFEKMNLCFDNR
jgi:hypothetical protein